MEKTSVQHIAGEADLQRPWGKTPFLALAWVAYAIFVALVVLVVYFAEPRLRQIGDFALWGAFAIAGVVLAAVGGGLLLITLTAATGIDLLYPHGRTQITMRVLPPVVYALGTLILRIPKDKLRESFVALSNALFWAQAKRGRFKSERLLILLPHCLQWHDCPWKITWSIENCRRCGRCPLGDLVDLHGRNGIYVYVATGGTIARRVVSEAKPTMILAVACPRDLAEGMVDVYPIPVYGILLSRPHGPCFDTKLELGRVFDFFKTFRPDAYELLRERGSELVRSSG